MVLTVACNIIKTKLLDQSMASNIVWFCDLRIKLLSDEQMFSMKAKFEKIAWIILMLKFLVLWRSKVKVKVKMIFIRYEMKIEFYFFFQTWIVLSTNSSEKKIYGGIKMIFAWYIDLNKNS